MSEYIDIDLLLEKAKIFPADYRFRNKDRMFICYDLDGRQINIEISVPDFVLSLLRLSPKQQLDLIEVLLDFVPEAGDYAIVDDHNYVGPNDKHHYSMRVVRARSDDDESARLLITG